MKDEQDYRPPTREDILSDLDKPLRNKLLLIRVFEFETAFTIEECVERLQTPIPMKYSFFNSYCGIDVFPLRGTGYAFSGHLCDAQKEIYAPTLEMSGMFVQAKKTKVRVIGRASSVFSVFLGAMLLAVALYFFIFNQHALALGNPLLIVVIIVCSLFGTVLLVMGVINRNRMITALKTRLTSP